MCVYDHTVVFTRMYIALLVGGYRETLWIVLLQTLKIDIFSSLN